MPQNKEWEPKVCLPPIDIEDDAKAGEVRYLPDSGKDPCAKPRGCATLLEARQWCEHQYPNLDFVIWKRIAKGKHGVTYRVAAVRSEGQWLYIHD